MPVNCNTTHYRATSRCQTTPQMKHFWLRALRDVRVSWGSVSHTFDACRFSCPFSCPSSIYSWCSKVQNSIVAV